MKITSIPLEEAVGRPLAHDLTQIDAKNHKKSARFKKGQVITMEDIPTLRDMGRENLSVMEMSPGDVHEDDAALALGEVLCGENLRLTQPEEGRAVVDRVQQDRDTPAEEGEEEPHRAAGVYPEPDPDGGHRGIDRVRPGAQPDTYAGHGQRAAEGFLAGDIAEVLD